jgi:hypothetical protein
MGMERMSLGTVERPPSDDDALFAHVLSTLSERAEHSEEIATLRNRLDTMSDAQHRALNSLLDREGLGFGRFKVDTEEAHTVLPALEAWLEASPADHTKASKELVTALQQ